MTDQERAISRRTLLRGAAGVAGVGVAASTLASCSQASTNSGPTKNRPVSVYHSIANFRPPPIAITVARPGTVPGVIVTDVHDGSGQQGPMIIDTNGDLIWFRPVSDNGTPTLRAMDLRVQTYKGQPVLTWYQGPVVGGHGEGVYIIADTSYRTIATVHAGNGLMGDLHEFFLTDQGTAIFSTYGIQYANLSSYGGATQGNYLYGEVQEVDVATGKLLFSWRTDRYIHLDESHVAPSKNGSVRWDYFHLNSVAIDPDDGNLVISSRNCWAFYKVHRTTGQLLWRLGGKKSDFAMGPDTHFAFQHHVTPNGKGSFSIFDNESAPLVHPPSRALFLQVDETKRTATFVRAFVHAPPLIAGSSGTVQVLDNGGTFVGWGAKPYFSEYDANGHLILDGHLVGAGLISYRAFLQPWSATPSGPPSVVLARSGANTLVYVSWNGATEVARWRVLAGPSSDQLAAVKTVRKKGFETRIVVAKQPPYIVVEALDAQGNLLGISGVHHL